jgi:hypothetical protein
VLGRERRGNARLKSVKTPFCGRFVLNCRPFPKTDRPISAWESNSLREKKYTAEMIGEALREAGTLVLVFAPLYVIFERSNATWFTLLSVLVVAVVLLIIGIQVERKRL